MAYQIVHTRTTGDKSATIVTEVAVYAAGNDKKKARELLTKLNDATFDRYKVFFAEVDGKKSRSYKVDYHDQNKAYVQHDSRTGSSWERDTFTLVKGETLGPKVFARIKELNVYRPGF